MFFFMHKQVAQNIFKEENILVMLSGINKETIHLYITAVQVIEYYIFS